MSAGPINPTPPAPLPRQESASTTKSPRGIRQAAEDFGSQVERATARALDGNVVNDAAIQRQQHRVDGNKPASDVEIDTPRKAEVDKVAATTQPDADALDDASLARTRRNTRKGPAERRDGGFTAKMRTEDAPAEAAEATDEETAATQDGKAADKPTASDKNGPVDADGDEADVDLADGAEDTAAAPQAGDEAPETATTGSARATEPQPETVDPTKLSALADSLRAEPAERAEAVAQPASPHVTSYRQGLRERAHLDLVAVIKTAADGLLGDLADHLREDLGWTDVMREVLPIVLAQTAQRPVVVFDKVEGSDAVKPSHMLSASGQIRIDLSMHGTNDVTSVPKHNISLAHLKGDKYAPVEVRDGGFTTPSRAKTGDQSFYDAAVGQLGETGEQSFEGRDLRHLLAQHIDDNRPRLTSNGLLVGGLFSRLMSNLLTPTQLAAAMRPAQNQPDMAAHHGQPTAGPMAPSAQQVLPPQPPAAAMRPVATAAHGNAPMGGGRPNANLSQSLAQLFGRIGQTGAPPTNPAQMPQPQMQPTAFGAGAQPAYPGGMAGTPAWPNPAAGLQAPAEAAPQRMTEADKDRMASLSAYLQVRS